MILRNTQIKGLDYDETFAHVAEKISARTLLSVATTEKWKVHKIDVHKAFLHYDLSEDV